MAENIHATKKRGKTEVYPFWELDDIKNMIEFFKMKEWWQHYLTFMTGLLLGRRVGDTLSLKWRDIYYENGNMKDEIESLEEEKTGKQTRPYLCGAYKNAVTLYIEKTKINPFDDMNMDIIPSKRKNELYASAADYTADDYNAEYWKAIDSQAAVYRRCFKQAAEACDIKYPVSTHSTRKTFGYWSKAIHPYDVESLDILQRIFAHSDRQTTMAYIGLTREKEIKYYKDMGDFITDVEAGNKPVIKNAPVVALKSADLRSILIKAYAAGRKFANSPRDEVERELIEVNKLMEIVEQKMVI